MRVKERTRKVWEHEAQLLQMMHRMRHQPILADLASLMLPGVHILLVLGLNTPNNDTSLLYRE